MVRTTTTKRFIPKLSLVSIGLPIHRSRQKGICPWVLSRELRGFLTYDGSLKIGVFSGLRPTTVVVPSGEV